MDAFSAAALAEGQAAAEAVMRDTCLVRRPGGAEAMDPETGKVSPGYLPEPVHQGRCRIQQVNTQARQQVSGLYGFTLLGSTAQFPASAGPFQVDDVVEITASEDNPALVGRRYRIVETMEKSHQTSRKARVEEVAR